MTNTRTEVAFTPIIAPTLVHCSQGEDLYDAQWHSTLWHKQAQAHAQTLVCGSACPVVKHYAIMRPTMVLAQWMHAWAFHHRFHILCRADIYIYIYHQRKLRSVKTTHKGKICIKVVPLCKLHLVAASLSYTCAQDGLDTAQLALVVLYIYISVTQSHTTESRYENNKNQRHA